MTTALPLPATTHTSSSFLRNLRLYASETRYEFLRLFRTRTFSLSVIGFPVMFYTLFGLLLNRSTPGDGMNAARYMLAGYAVFGAVGAALFGVGVSLAADFAAGWMELKRASPMPPVAYLLAKCTTAVGFGTIIVSILTLMGMAFGHVSLSLPDFARILGLTVACAVPFACMGLVMALLVPFNAAPGVTNLVYLPMSFLGGLWIPIRNLPQFFQKLAPVLPTFQGAQLMLHTLGFPSQGTGLGHTMYLTGFTLIMLGLAAILFHRRENNA
jgi:ABC-2 type transport system permease protein